MRSLLLPVAAALLLSACGTDLALPSKEARPSAAVSTTAPTPANDPSTWVMSPDSFGAITMETTRSEALDTGFYREAPAPCSALRLDWRGQTYKDEPGTAGRQLAKPHLASITFDGSGTPRFIDPGKDTATDQGIRRSDSLSRLQLTYGDDLISGADQGPAGGTFAVTGEQSHLVYVVMYGKVVGFFIAAGHVEEPDEVIEVAAALSELPKWDGVRQGRSGPC